MRFKVEVVAQSRVEKVYMVNEETPGAAMQEAINRGRTDHPGASVFVVDVKPVGEDVGRSE